MPPNHTKLVR